MNIFFNHPYNIDDMAANMLLHHSNRQFQQRHAQSLVQKYFENVTKYLFDGVMYAYQHQIDRELCPMDWTSLRSSLGKYGSKPHQQWWLYWLHDNYPLVTVVKKGNSFQGERTMVRPLHNLNWQSDIEDLLEPQDLWNYYFNEVTITDLMDPLQFDLVEIDMVSLNNYILDNQKRQNETRYNDKYLKTLRNNLRQAIKIRKIATYFGEFTGLGLAVLPQRIRESDFGRQYLVGVNLQSVNKEIRKGALGDCYQYDIEASVFAWKINEAKTIDPNFKCPATIEYLDEKTVRRQQIALNVFGDKKTSSVETIKRAITAIGFGARKTNSCWLDPNNPYKNGDTSKPNYKMTAFRDIIPNKEQLDKFFADPWVSEFIDEQTRMTAVIYQHHKHSLEGNELLESRPGVINKSQAMAWLYQHAERRLMDAVIAQLDNYDIALTCHDAFYSRDNINPALINEIVREINPWARVSREFLKGYLYIDSQAVDDHYMRMLAEEQRANNGVLPDAVFKGYQRAEAIKKPRRNYQGSDEFDNGYRSGPQEDEHE